MRLPTEKDGKGLFICFWASQSFRLMMWGTQYINEKKERVKILEISVDRAADFREIAELLLRFVMWEDNVLMVALNK